MNTIRTRLAVITYAIMETQVASNTPPYFEVILMSVEQAGPSTQHTLLMLRGSDGESKELKIPLPEFVDSSDPRIESVFVDQFVAFCKDNPDYFTMEIFI